VSDLRRNGASQPALLRSDLQAVRRPRYGCSGRRVEISNADTWSGVRIDFGDTQLPEDTPLFVNGIECQAREAHLGGIVIQPVAAWDESRRLIEERRQVLLQSWKEG